MTDSAHELWERALAALDSARILQRHGRSDDAASRTYYAAFHAVSALFALEARFFKKHSAVEAAVHRDLVKRGRWPVDLGQAYSKLRDLRETGDYGAPDHVESADLDQALLAARRIVEAVYAELPDAFTPVPSDD